MLTVQQVAEAQVADALVLPRRTALRKPGDVLGWESVLVFFRAPGGQKARQETTARKDTKQGRREGRKEVSTEGGQEGREGRKEGRDRIFVHICAGNPGSNNIFC